MTPLLLTTSAVEIEIDPLDWPRCALCHMPVENFRATDTGDSITFVTMCHGEVELATIPDEVWDTVMGTHVKLGSAFSTGTQGDQNDRTTLD